MPVEAHVGLQILPQEPQTLARLGMLGPQPNWSLGFRKNSDPA